MNGISNWSSFVQINIYGWKLHEMKKNGVDVAAFLNSNGCDKFYINDIPMYDSSVYCDTDSTKDCELIDNDREENERVFEMENRTTGWSTTLVETKFPHCSTPIYSARYPSLKIPGGLISSINSEADTDDETLNSAMKTSQETNKVEECARDIIHEMLEVVESTDSSSRREVRPPVTRSQTKSMIINKANPSKPVKRHNSVIPKLSNQALTGSKHEKLKMSALVIQESNLVAALDKQLSASPTAMKNIKEEVLIEPVERSGPLVYHPPAVKLESRTSDVTPVIGYAQNTREISDYVYHDLKTVCPVEPEETYAFHSAENILDGPGTSDNFQRQSQYLDVSFMDDGDFGVAEREETMLIDHYEEVVENKPHIQVIENEEDKDDEQDVEEDQGNEHGSNSDVNIRTTKKVSFAQPLIQSSNQKKAEMNKAHTIKCYFKGCEKKYVWRKKYGKMRLVDHALTHIPNLEMKCELCDLTFRKIRSVRYHHKTAHHNNPLEGFGIRQVVSTSKKDADFGNIWDICYKKNLVLRHVSSGRQAERLDKGMKRPRDVGTAPFSTSTDDAKSEFQIH